MGNSVALRQVISDELTDLAAVRRELIVLTSDSRGSAAAVGFARAFPEQFVDVGIAEQNLVGVAAGLASCGKVPFVMSPACFLSMRSIEQVKVDVAYSNTNVKLIGISGGVSYGALGMSHHSLQDIAVVRAIPGMTVLLPADRHEAKKMIRVLVDHRGGAYVRIGRNPVPDVHESDDFSFEIGKAIMLRDGFDLTLIGAGETVKVIMDAAETLSRDGIRCRVINMHTLKPLDEEAIIRAAEETGLIITVEEHSVHGGLGSAVAEVVTQHQPVPMKIIGIPDEPAIAGTTAQVFGHYGITADNIRQVAQKMLGAGKWTKPTFSR